MGEIHPEVAQELMSIGHAYYDCRLYSQALLFYQNAYVTYRLFGLTDKHPSVIQVLLDMDDAEVLFSENQED